MPRNLCPALTDRSLGKAYAKRKVGPRKRFKKSGHDSHSKNLGKIVTQPRAGPTSEEDMGGKVRLGDASLLGNLLASSF